MKLNKQKLLITLAILIAVILSIFLVIQNINSRNVQQVSYKGWIASSAEEKGCLGKRGLYVQLDTLLKERLPSPEAKRLAEANTPTNTSLKTKDKSYPLVIDTKTSTQGNGQIFWVFNPISLDEQTAASLIDTKASILYKINDKSYSTSLIKIEDGSCKSLI